MPGADEGDRDQPAPVRQSAPYRPGRGLAQRVAGDDQAAAVIEACWAATSSSVMLTMPCGSRAQTSATASLRSTGWANKSRYDVASGCPGGPSSGARCGKLNISVQRDPRLNCIQFCV